MNVPFKLVKTETFEALQRAYQQLMASTKAATVFIKEIETGNLGATFQGESADSEGLREALLSMQLQLQKISEEEKERGWATHGMAMFAELLRSSSTSTAHFYQKIISTLVNYLEVNQGGLFLLDEQEGGSVTIELAACYAYNRQKHLKKQITPGEGLIGQCYLEKDTIYMTDIPQNYVNITSGLGTANPSCLVIVPLLLNKEVHGFLEIASFSTIKPHKVAFLERLGESIASTIANVKVNERTRRLLQDSQQQAEELRAQEEEMRQNMEELSATQENQNRLQRELIANEEELKKQLNALQEARAETEQVRQLEQERANKRIETQTKATEKLVAKFRQSEAALKAELQQLKEELNQLKAHNLQSA
ncbi:GAF domain-containing protein [Cesiribacter andamanensis]|uniref:Putative periplasmic ligand-binding sensor domain protein n=1 Tax=Cesiribacter andamanensis AMV16 TaxID=1279009 RepID=M7N822_9BACT|nr:GAF domain-containing protein [Cesiribacter andamanensis]EMR04743.1 putative periplasmic ligand-binding sensor domain protein [Cesiribacter andamanensis AMV16]